MNKLRPPRQTMVGFKPGTPCKGVCSATALGDANCIGCGRAHEEVRDWNKYGEDKQRAIMTRADLAIHGIYIEKQELVGDRIVHTRVDPAEYFIAPKPKAKPNMIQETELVFEFEGRNYGYELDGYKPYGVFDVITCEDIGPHDTNIYEACLEHATTVLEARNSK